MTLAPGTKLGPYEILAPLGAGGMGEVWKARDTRLDRLVAVKVLPEHLAENAEALSRFEREAKAVAALNHPNILALHDIGRQESTAYAVMELLEGETLRARLAGGALPARKAVELAVQMAEGLAAAHDRGIVHRDLKPENLWITREGRLKILDFGLAKVGAAVPDAAGSEAETRGTSHEARTAEGVILGTLGYMSPEQVRSEALDARSDIFSFGAVLYEMLTGTRAFARGSSADTLAAILKEEPAEISSSGTTVSPGLDRVVRRCLEKTPHGRFQTARDLAFALDNLSSGTGGSGPAAAAAQPRSARPARTRAVMAGMLLVGTVAGAILGAWALWNRPRPFPSFRRLTFGRGAIDGARFVPGSRDIAYSARWQGSPSTVYLLREGSMEPRALEAEGALLLAASSQGDIAVLTGSVLYSGLLEGRLSVLPLAGGGAREISGLAAAADFPVDGSSLCLVTRQTTHLNQLEWPPGEVLLKSAGVLRSPRIRGTTVAFFRSTTETGDDGEIVVVARGEKPRSLAACRTLTGLAWGPGSEEIWYSTFDGGESLIQAVSLKGRTRVLARFPGRLELQDVDPGGRCLAIAVSHLRQAFGRAPGATQDADLTWLDAQTPMGLSADGRLVLLARLNDWSMADGATLYIRPLAGGPAVKLGTGSLDAALSPDGRWVATYEPGAAGQPGVRLIPTGAGASRWFALSNATRHPDQLWFGPDGRSLFTHEFDRQHVSRLDLASGAVTGAITSAGVSIFNGQEPMAPDGRRMVFEDSKYSAPAEDPSRHGFVLFEGEETAPRPAKGILAGEAPARWDEASREVYIYNRNAIPASVFRWNPDTAARRPFLQITPPDPSGVWGIQDLRMTPSGRAYAYSVVRRLSDLYLVEGLR